MDQKPTDPPSGKISRLLARIAPSSPVASVMRAQNEDRHAGPGPLARLLLQTGLNFQGLSEVSTALGSTSSHQ